MAISTITGTLRTGSRGKSSSVGTPNLTMQASFDPTSATQIELFTLPANAIPTVVTSLGGSTGGTNPTVDIGTLADDDGFANELASDAVTTATPGALTGIKLTADTIVYGKVGASAATGGTTTILFTYVMSVSPDPNVTGPDAFI